MLLTLKTNSQRTAQVFLILFSEGHATAWIFFEAKRKKIKFFFWLDDQARALQRSSWIGTARHDSPQVGGEGNSPPRARSPTRGTVQARRRSDPERTACPLVSLMSQDHAETPPRMLQEQHGGVYVRSNALHVSRSLLERQRASRGVTFEPVKCSFLEGKK